MRKGGIAEKIIFLLFFAGLLSLLAVSAMAAARRGRGYEPQQGMTQQQSPADLRRQEMEQQAQQAASLIDRALDDFFKQINNWQDPEEIYVKSAAVLLEDNRRYMMYMSDPQKAQYMLLQGWVEYCNGELTQANTYTARACRLDGANRDAWISQQYFAVLEGKRPLQPRPPRPQTGRRGDPMEMAQDYTAAQSLYGTSGKLDFDPESLREDLIGRTLEPFTATFQNGMPLIYEHDKEILCMAVREIPAADLEEKPQTETGQQLLYTQPDAPAQPNYGYDEYGGGAAAAPAASNEGLQQQLAAMELLETKASASKDLRFFSVITNKASQKADVIRYLSGKEQTLPLLLADDTVKELAVNVEAPFILVVDKAGQFRFAGSGQGFVLPMLLGRLTGIPFSKQAQAEQAVRRESMEYMMIERGMRPVMGDPNRPAGPMDPNSPARMRRPPRGRAPQPPAPSPQSKQMMQDLQEQTMDPTERIPTQDLTANDMCGYQQLAAARDFFMQAAGRRFITYRRGIELCRQVIRECPDSPNAEAARQLLRNSVPEEQRERYNLTNEELGLQP